MNFPYYEIELFLKVTQYKTLSSASEKLGLGQSALSQAIKRLETHFNSRLLTRSKKGIILNKQGEKFVLLAKEIIQAKNQLQLSLDQESGALTGDYQIGMHSSIAQFIFPVIGPYLLKNHPKLNIELIHEPSIKMTELILNHKIDFSFAINPPSHPDIILHFLLEEEFTLWKHTHLKIKNPPLIYAPNISQSIKINNNLYKNKINFNRWIKSTSFDFIKSSIINKLGVGILPKRIILPKDQLVPFSKDIPSFQQKLYLLYHFEFTKNNLHKVLSKDLINLVKSSFNL